MAIEGKVAKVLANNTIVINRGRDAGVRPGMLFEVLEPRIMDFDSSACAAIAQALNRTQMLAMRMSELEALEVLSKNLLLKKKLILNQYYLVYLMNLLIMHQEMKC